MSSDLQIRSDWALGSCNTLAIAQRAEAFVEISDGAQLPRALEWARQRHLPVLPLGQGSNVVFTEDLRALVLRQRMRGVAVLDADKHHVMLRVAAGENWHGLVCWTLREGYYGIENLALIPGDVGAAPIQNIGAYGVELQSCLRQVHAVRLEDHATLTLDNSACGFGYRDSIFKRELRDRVIITAIDIRLSMRPTVNTSYPALSAYFRERAALEQTPQSVFDAVVAIRRSKLPDPAVDPNVGSFFKNPVLPPAGAALLLARHADLPAFPQHDGAVKLSAAWMIEQCGWKGVRRGPCGVHPRHALVLVNHGGASGRQVLALADEIAASVLERFGVTLEVEPRVYGACP